MRRSEHMQRRDVDVVIGNNRTLCCDGFDNAAASTLDILILPTRIRIQMSAASFCHRVAKDCSMRLFMASGVGLSCSRHGEDEAADERECQVQQWTSGRVG